MTFAPFETYVDYWGTYKFDPASGALTLKVDDGNNVPAELDLEGKAQLEDGHLILDGFFLGSGNSNAPLRTCRYKF